MWLQTCGQDRHQTLALTAPMCAFQVLALMASRLPLPSKAGKQAIAWCLPVIAKNVWYKIVNMRSRLLLDYFDLFCVSFRLCSCISPWRVTISSSELHWLVSFPSDSFATQFPSRLCQMHCRMDSGMSLTCSWPGKKGHEAMKYRLSRLNLTAWWLDRTGQAADPLVDIDALSFENTATAEDCPQIARNDLWLICEHRTWRRRTNQLLNGSSLG